MKTFKKNAHPDVFSCLLKNVDLLLKWSRHFDMFLWYQLHVFLSILTMFFPTFFQHAFFFTLKTQQQITFKKTLLKKKLKTILLFCFFFQWNKKQQQKNCFHSSCIFCCFFEEKNIHFGLCQLNVNDPQKKPTIWLSRM